MATVTREQQERLDNAIGQLIIALTFRVPRGTNLHEALGKELREFRDAAAALASPPAEDESGTLAAAISRERQRHIDEATKPLHDEIARLKAQAPPASDPPGLVANWRPIETAPKRTDVLAGWADRPHWLPQVLQQDDAGMWFNGEESDYRPPTHWMPLPASPQAKED